MSRYRFPDRKRFAFTILDDTDVATAMNVRPIYRLFEELGMRTTKTVWTMPCPEGSPNFFESETLEDPAYEEFVVDLQARGFEIASHGATMESSTRERTVVGLDRFRETFGHYPRIHANHSHNRENLYWGKERLDDPILRFVYGRLNGRPTDYYQGHVEGSPYWWGDLFQRHVEYVRNLTFDEVNLLRVNPTMPYSDPRRPLGHWWFSGSDAEGAAEFKALLTTERLDQLEEEGGVCILATHLGKEYVRSDGKVDREVRAILEGLGERNGWFPTVGELLDHLRLQNGGGPLPRGEWRRMQWRWWFDLVRRKYQR